MWRKIAWGIFVFFMIISLLPYMIPVTKSTGELIAPFENSQFANIEGVTIHYRVWETETTTPHSSAHVLLVHGLAGSTFSWRDTVEVLRKTGHTVVAVDLPGFGYSDRSRGINHSQENRAALLWNLIDQIEKDSLKSNYVNEFNWNLVGHSMGGGTVTSLALQKPEKTESVVFVDAAVLSGGNPGGLFAKYPPVGRWVQVIGRHFLLKEHRIEAFLSSAYGRPATAEEVAGYLEPLQIHGTEGSFVDIIKTSTQTTTAELQNLQVPVRAIWGDKDSWVSLDDAYELRDLIEDYEIHVIVDAYHSPMETDSQDFNNMLLQLLSR